MTVGQTNQLEAGSNPIILDDSLLQYFTVPGVQSTHKGNSHNKPTNNHALPFIKTFTISWASCSSGGILTLHYDMTAGKESNYVTTDPVQQEAAPLNWRCRSARRAVRCPDPALSAESSSPSCVLLLLSTCPLYTQRSRYRPFRSTFYSSLC